MPGVGRVPTAPNTGTASPAHLRIQREVAKLWLRGSSYLEIQDGLVSVIGHRPDYHYVLAIVKTIRNELREFHRAQLDEHTNRCIEVLRMVQRRCWDDLEASDGTDASKLLNVVVRAEETIAKVSGVLTDKVQHIGDLMHHIKLYDFQDRYPQLIELQGQEIANDTIPDELLIQDEGEFNSRMAAGMPPSKRLKNAGYFDKSGYLCEDGSIVLEEGGF